MIKQIKLVNTKKGLERYDFYYKCAFCKVLTEKLQNNACNFCFKYFNYVDEKNVAFFNIKNILIEISRRKFDDNISCFKFKKLEQKVVEESENNPCFFYNRQSMNWHIDFGFDPQNTVQINSIIDTSRSIVENICKNADISLADINAFVDDAANKIDCFDKDRSTKLPFIMPELHAGEINDQNNSVFLTSMDRNVILRNFYENLFLPE